MAGFSLQCLDPPSEHSMICVVNPGEADSHAAAKFHINYFTDGVKALSFMDKLYSDRGPRRKLGLRVNIASAETDIGSLSSNCDIGRRVNG